MTPNRRASRIYLVASGGWASLVAFCCCFCIETMTETRHQILQPDSKYSINAQIFCRIPENFPEFFSGNISGKFSTTYFRKIFRKIFQKLFLKYFPENFPEFVFRIYPAIFSGKNNATLTITNGRFSIIYHPPLLCCRF